MPSRWGRHAPVKSTLALIRGYVVAVGSTTVFAVKECGRGVCLSAVF